MDECRVHDECTRKLTQNCLDMAATKERLETLEYDCKQLNNSIYGSGGADSIKSRIKGTEDAVSGLKELVLENREVVKDTVTRMKSDSERDLKGFFKIFCLAIGASAVLVGAMFTFLWTEMKDVNATMVSLRQHQVRQVREPSPSPQLPFEHNLQGEITK